MGSRKKKSFKIESVQQVDNPITAKDLVQKVKSLPKSASSKTVMQSPTDSLPNNPKKNIGFAEDSSSDDTKEGTQTNYKQLYEDEKISNMLNEVNSKTNLVGAKIETEIERIKTFVENKFSSFIKWGIGIVVAIISIPIGVNIFLLDNHSDKIENKFNLQIEKRITPVEKKINSLEVKDSLNHIDKEKKVYKQK